MIPLAIKIKDVTQEHVSLRYRVEMFIHEKLPEDLSCHEVCEAVANAPEFKDVFEWHKGKFHGTWDHSWLVFKVKPGVAGSSTKSPASSESAWCPSTARRQRPSSTAQKLGWP